MTYEDVTPSYLPLTSYPYISKGFYFSSPLVIRHFSATFWSRSPILTNPSRNGDSLQAQAEGRDCGDLLALHLHPKYP